MIQDHLYIWKPRGTYLSCQKTTTTTTRQTNKTTTINKTDFSDRGKDQFKPNPVTRRDPSVISRSSDSLARLTGASLHFVQKETSKHEMTCLNQQKLSSTENGKTNHCIHICTVNCGRDSEHSTLSPYPSGSLGLQEAHSLWFIENKHEILV